MTFNKGIFMYEEELEFQQGSIILRYYTTILEIDPNNDGKNMISVLNPRMYNSDAFSDLRDWIINRGVAIYKNAETQELINVKKDYNTTPGRKKKKPIVWDVDPRAEHLLHTYGFTRLC